MRRWWRRRKRWEVVVIDLGRSHWGDMDNGNFEEDG